MRLTLIDILVPPQNPWLCAYVPGKTPLPQGVRIVSHVCRDDDSYYRNTCLRKSWNKLQEIADGRE